ncbi:MAG: TfoX/Sxy family protein, partial [Parvibaculaceae bacterium]
PVGARRMFGGYGLFREGLMFGLVADDTLYFKADGESKTAFEREGLDPFSYETAGGKRVVMAYWRAPEQCLEDPDAMAEWCGMAYAAALRSPAGQKKGGRSRPKPKR